MTPPKSLATKSSVPAPQSFESWIAVPVILHTSVGELCVPLRGTVVRESGELLRFRMGEGWDVDIYKSMVLRIEPDCWNGTT